MGYREEELKAKGQKAMIEVDELKHKIRALEKEVAILQEQLQKRCNGKIKIRILNLFKNYLQNCNIILTIIKIYNNII